MTRHPPTPAAAVLLGVVLAASATGCAPASGPAPAVTVPETPPTTPTSSATAGPTATGRTFTPTPVPTGRTGVPAGGLPAASTLASPDPNVVAAAGLTAYYRADTVLDLGPADTHRRALPWTTGQLTAGLRGDRPVTGPGALWTALGAHHGYTTVTVTRAYDDGAPADTRARVYRQFTVATTPRGRDGWTGPLIAHTDYLTMTRTNEGWRIVLLQDQLLDPDQSSRHVVSRSGTKMSSQVSRCWDMPCSW